MWGGLFLLLLFKNPIGGRQITRHVSLHCSSLEDHSQKKSCWLSWVVFSSWGRAQRKTRNKITRREIRRKQTWQSSMSTVTERVWQKKTVRRTLRGPLLRGPLPTISLNVFWGRETQTQMKWLMTPFSWCLFGFDRLLLDDQFVPFSRDGGGRSRAGLTTFEPVKTSNLLVKGLNGV